MVKSCLFATLSLCRGSVIHKTPDTDMENAEFEIGRIKIKDIFKFSMARALTKYDLFYS